MQESNEIKQLLTEIRDLQRESLGEYKKVTQRSLELQQQAVTRQEQLGRLYRRVVLAGSLLIMAIVILLVYLLGKLR
ncbi:MAG TPA: hypothetical protein VE135_20900 [Pyrinomonadaceae bacterium]|nr:hypothetical protein [Pyrinomonadaceae bacterium]